MFVGSGWRGWVARFNRGSKEYLKIIAEYYVRFGATCGAHGDLHACFVILTITCIYEVNEQKQKQDEAEKI